MSRRGRLQRSACAPRPGAYGRAPPVRQAAPAATAVKTAAAIAAPPANVTFACAPAVSAARYDAVLDGVGATRLDLRDVPERIRFACPALTRSFDGAHCPRSTGTAGPGEYKGHEEGVGCIYSDHAVHLPIWPIAGRVPSGPDGAFQGSPMPYRPAFQGRRPESLRLKSRLIVPGMDAGIPAAISRGGRGPTSRLKRRETRRPQIRRRAGQRHDLNKCTPTGGRLRPPTRIGPDATNALAEPIIAGYCALHERPTMSSATTYVRTLEVDVLLLQRRRFPWPHPRLSSLGTAACRYFGLRDSSDRHGRPSINIVSSPKAARTSPPLPR